MPAQPAPASTLPPHSSLAFSALKALPRRLFALACLAVLSLSLPGCQSLTTASSEAQVRIIDVSPDAPALDVFHASGPLAYNLNLGTGTSYVAIAPGPDGILAAPAGTRQQLLSAQGTFLPGGQYTVLLGDSTDALHEIILKDQSQPAPAGQAALRFLHQSTRAAALDLYLIPAGSTILAAHPVLTGIAFNVNSGYINLPAGTYTLVALSAGTIPAAPIVTSYTGPAITYASGSARTIVFIDQQLPTTPGVQAVIANDFDPSAPIL